MADYKKAPRYWYEYNGQKHLVPSEFVYKLYEGKGGGHDINAAFFSWAFNKHDISIIDYKTLYANQTDLRLGAKSKEDKANIPTGIVYFSVMCKGKDKRGVEKVGVGEVGNESITNFQRGFPFGIAAKRARVNMGKEFFGLTDLNYAIDCRDYEIDFGDQKGKTLNEVCKTKEGINTVRWYASDKFTGSPVLKAKAKELVEKYIDKQNHSTPNQNNGNTQNAGQTQKPQTNNRPQNQNTNTNTNNTQSEKTGISPLTKEQKDAFATYRDGKSVPMTEITNIGNLVTNNNFSWKTATKEQGDKMLAKLEQKYGKI